MKLSLKNRKKIAKLSEYAVYPFEVLLKKIVQNFDKKETKKKIQSFL